MRPFAVLVVAVLGQAAPAPTSLDFTVYGVAGVTIAILLGLLYAERAARTKAETQLVEMAQSLAGGLAEATAAINRNTDATRDLTSEVRGGGRR